jgi:2-polyprenyl-3-methyl-5-hydroxy-6-metoxy-1,4-benzoquinol methylase
MRLGTLVTTDADLVELQQTLYTSRNPTRRWLHESRRAWVTDALRREAGRASIARALEIGPGSGVYLPILAEVAGEVVASDVEQAFLRHAEAMRSDLPGLRTEVDDITRSALPPGSFDLVLCSEVIEHIRDSAGALRSIRRLLRPGGLLVLTTPQRWSPAELTARVATLPGVIGLSRRIYREPIQPLGHINLLTRREAERQLLAAGFRIERRHLGGLYLPLVAEAGGRRALALERSLEAAIRTGPLRGLLWTQYYVARA